MTFIESKFLASILVLDTRYKYFRSQNNNSFYLFNNQVVYTLVHYFANSETTKNNIDKFLTNFLIKLITKHLLYYNGNK